MVARASACHPQQLERLERLVHDELAEGQVEELSLHLEDCAACRNQLDQLAGGQAWFAETRRFLSGTDLEVAPLSNHELPQISKHDLHFLQPSDNPNALGKLDDYEVHEVLGRGGMGIVLKAFETSLGRWVAIKVLAPPFSSQGVARQRFAREAQAAAAVVHPNVMAIHRVAPQADPPYFVMPLVTGQSLQHLIDQNGSLAVEETLRVAAQVADGLAAAHAQGLIHRDVKPANILLDPGTNRVILTDFGLARAADDASLTCTGLIAGTPQYMSPEQARGESLNHQADLFSLGAVIYTMVTGRPPFRAASTYGLLRKIADTPAKPLCDSNPQTPHWLQQIVDRLLAKQPHERYRTASQLATDLRACLAHVQQPGNCPLPPHLKPRPLHRYTTLARTPAVQLALGLTLLLAIGLTSLTALGWLPSPWKQNTTAQPEITAQQKAAETTARAASLQPSRNSQANSNSNTDSVTPSGTPSINTQPPDTSPTQPTWDDQLSREIDSLEKRLSELEQATDL